MTSAANKRAVRGALGYSFAQRYGEGAVRIGSLMVLARFVGPDGFGAFAVAYGVASLLAGSIRHAVNAFVVRSPAEGEPGLGSPFMVCAGVAAVFGLTLALAADPLARLVGVPDAAGPFRLLSLVFLFTPLEAVFGGLLSRRLAFGVIALVGFGAVLVGAGVSVGLAASGLDETALAAGALTELALMGLGSALAARGAWPLLARRGAPLGDAARFCARVGAGNLVSGAGKLTATLATARFLGPSAVGLYDRARRVTWTFGDLVLNAVSPVVLPALAETKRAGTGLGAPYLFKLQAISLAAWPFFAALAVSAEPVVLLLLGPDWRAAVPLVQAACLFGVPMPYHVTDTPFLIAADKERTYLRIQLAAQAISLVLIVAAAQVGVAWVLIAHAVGKAAKAAMTTGVLTRAFGLDARRVMLAGAESAFVAGGVAGAAWAVQAIMPRADDARDALLVVGVIGLACGLSLVALTLLVRHPVRAEADAIVRQGARRVMAVVRQA